MPLGSIDFATDEELERYESEIVTLASEYGVSLASVRDAVTAELVEEAHMDGIDQSKVYDDEGEVAKAMRAYATRKALRIFWEDISLGREGSSTEGKAKRAQVYEESARRAFRATGWPVDTSGDEAVTIDDVVTPEVIRFTR